MGLWQNLFIKHPYIKQDKTMSKKLDFNRPLLYNGVMEKKSLLFKILNVLQSESSADNPLTYEEVIDLLGTNESINRKTVANNFETLKNNGYIIKRITVKTPQKYSFTKSKTGWYLETRNFDKDEVFMLLNLIMEHENINDIKIQTICRKILKSLPRADKEIYLYNDPQGKQLKQAIDMNPNPIKLFETRKHTGKKSDLY
ncbi:MAG: hypothetical protein LBP79_00895 [Clostridiales bacterium]|nr:hypothetical protein [Clostridiales bacterium]